MVRIQSMGLIINSVMPFLVNLFPALSSTIPGPYF